MWWLSLVQTGECECVSKTAQSAVELKLLRNFHLVPFLLLMKHLQFSVFNTLYIYLHPYIDLDSEVQIYSKKRDILSRKN